VTVTGYGLGNTALGKARAANVASYLKRYKSIHVRVMASAASKNSATVTTTEQ
jgi:outer membrane protein OmpA-like peptidoglycan-associated protein